MVSYSSPYAGDWALVIGIDAYQSAPPLRSACNDARAVTRLLIEQFGFPEENVILLTEQEATRTSIMDAYLDLAGKTGSDDRVLFFFAGHGYTHSGQRGEVGFLVPVEGSTAKLSSLIRWDELTRNAELLPAKHILFAMDACYGGLAITRNVPPGGTRFLKDMLRRPARQVLTAGKADEAVADSGGPLPGHSLFTGHFLQALQGGAADQEGTITANGVMAYVYDRVPKDLYSRQTPHYGHIDGDGDFVFCAPVLEQIPEKPGAGTDILIEVPPTAVDAVQADHEAFVREVKELISDQRYRIRLDDLATRETRRLLSLATNDKFPTNTEATPEAISDRLTQYETIVRNVQVLVTLLAHWGNQEQAAILCKIVTRVAEQEHSQSGAVVWLNLQWYPAARLTYSGCIAAIASGSYQNLRNLLQTPIYSRPLEDKREEAVVPIMGGLLHHGDPFKFLSAHKKHHVPHSEYLFTSLQPDLDDLLFLGRAYEAIFDRFEVLQALVFADLSERETGHVWGPLGRFGWKFGGGRMNANPFAETLQEASHQEDDWPPVKAGLFGASYQRFSEISSRYQEEILAPRSWW